MYGNKHGTIPLRRFEIEGETFVIAPKDEEEPKTAGEALSSPVRTAVVL